MTIVAVAGVRWFGIVGFGMRARVCSLVRMLWVASKVLFLPPLLAYVFFSVDGDWACAGLWTPAESVC